MQVEHIAREGLTAGRTPQQQRQLAVGHRVLGQIVVNYERVLAVIAEVLADRTPGIRGDELQGGGVRSTGDHDGRVFQRAGPGQPLNHLGNGGPLLTDGDIDTLHVAALLVDDRIDDNGGFAGLAVADDEFALPATDRNHGINGLQTGLDRLFDRLAQHDARGFDLNTS